ncbi:MAG: hypothetical protein H6672_14950 [Anaerolineaceae bacterium]|nr:hypothetical protein [Anaerolineaceae bacterium]
MPLFVLFVFGTIVLGAGGMLAPAWETRQPRIGLMGALSLGIIMGGGIFWAMLFGWDTLVIDYLLFALVTAIFLGGTLSYGQMRAESRGEELKDSDQGWPGPRDLLFFGLVALVFAAPLLVLPVPLDTDAQGFGYLGLLARLGGDFKTLTPFHPEISYLYAPGFSLVTAYLSQQLGQGLHYVEMAVGAVLSILLVWLAYDFGAEYRDKRLGRAMAAVMFAGVGLFTAYMDSHYTTLLGLVFALAFLIFALRYLREGRWPDALAAGLMLGSVALAHPDTTIILALGYAPWLVTMWFGQPRPTLRRWLVLAVGVPLVALAGILPWLLSIRDLLGSDIVSPFTRDPNYWQVIIFYNGIWTVPVAILGAVIGLRKREQPSILAVGWLVFVLEFSTLGILEALIPSIIEPALRYDYPFSIAWHGPIIPFSILGGVGLLWLWDRIGETRLGTRLYRHAYAVFGILGIIVLLAVVFNQQILAFSKGKIGFYGAFSSHADVAAMTWLKENTPPDARILNFPGPQEGDWVPVVSERDSVYYRWQPFFRGDEDSLAEQERLRAFWENPADPANADLLQRADIDYVIVPQVVTDPASIETMFRWRPPFTELIEMQSSVADAPYLELVFDENGAQVYEVVDQAGN